MNLSSLLLQKSTFLQLLSKRKKRDLALLIATEFTVTFQFFNWQMCLTWSIFKSHCCIYVPVSKPQFELVKKYICTKFWVRGKKKSSWPCFTMSICFLIEVFFSFQGTDFFFPSSFFAMISGLISFNDPFKIISCKTCWFYGFNKDNVFVGFFTN